MKKSKLLNNGGFNEINFEVQILLYFSKLLTSGSAKRGENNLRPLDCGGTRIIARNQNPNHKYEY
jgi:hypothetical protein